MRALNYTLLAAYWAACFVWYAKLPAEYATHFNIRGEPDAWSTGPAAWFGLPALATATILLLIGIGKLAQRTPHLWNLPEKKRFLALTPDQRAPIMPVLAGMMDVAGLYSLLVFIVCQWAIYQSAINARGSLGLTFHTVVWGGVIVLLIYILRLNKRVKQMILAASSEDVVGRTS